ncbi:MAG: hypothetical protein HC851_13475 [Acaryochloris sp. RU_4_1]|nr:hypothetical protein [Acaryochloris sp. RU_4_1]
MLFLLAKLPGERLLDSTVQTQDHLKFWETFRSYIIGGDNPGAELIKTTLAPVVDMIVVVAILLIAARAILMASSAKGDLASVFQGNLGTILLLSAAIFLLAGGYVNAYNVSNGVWQVRQSVRQQTSQARVNAVKLASALNNQIFYHRFGARAELEFIVCEQKPRPAVALRSLERPGPEADPQPTKEQSQLYDYLECMDSAVRRLQVFQAQLAQECSQNESGCIDATARAQNVVNITEESVDGLKKFYQRDLDELTAGPNNTFLDSSEVPDIDLGFAAFDGNEPFIKAVKIGNWSFLSYLELGFALSGALFPGVIAVALMPTLWKVIPDWFVLSLNMIVVENLYLWIIGVVAVVAKEDRLQGFGSDIFLQFLGSTAPFAACAAGLFGGWMMARQYRGSAAAGVTLVGSAVSGIALTTLYTINSAKYLRK